MRLHAHSFLLLPGLGVLASVASPAAAQTTASDLASYPDIYLAGFSANADRAFVMVQTSVTYVTTALIVLSVVALGIKLATGDEDMTAMIPTFMRRVLFIGVILYLSKDWMDLTERLHRTLLLIGLMPSGGSMTEAQFFTPSGIMGMGLKTVGAMAFSLNWKVVTNLPFAFIDALIWAIASIFIMASFAVIAFRVIWLVVVFKLRTLVGAILLPFAIWQPTAWLAEQTPGAIFSTCVEIMTLAFVVSVGIHSFQTFPPRDPGNIGGVLAETCAAVFLACAALFLPGKISGMVSGGPNFASAS
jgi:type IV secretion system protein TrbL